MHFDVYNEEWLIRWREKRTGWDLGGPHPKILNLMDKLQLHSGFPVEGHSSVAVPGCGSGHDAHFISEYLKRTQVDAFDISEEAILLAKSRYLPAAKNNLNFFIHDVFEDKFPNSKKIKYDFVYDRAMLCALRPEQREAYIQWIYQNTGPKAFVGALIFDQVDSIASHRPPFEITKAMFYWLFQVKEWDVLCAETYPSNMESSVIKLECLYILQKK